MPIINPVESIKPALEPIKPAAGQPEGEGASFADIFKNAVENANRTEMTVKRNELLFASGQTDDLHSIMIDAAKAELALSLLVQVRNKALDAYNDIMKMTL